MTPKQQPAAGILSFHFPDTKVFCLCSKKISRADRYKPLPFCTSVINTDPSDPRHPAADKSRADTAFQERGSNNTTIDSLFCIHGIRIQGIGIAQCSRKPPDGIRSHHFIIKAASGPVCPVLTIDPIHRYGPADNVVFFLYKRIDPFIPFPDVHNFSNHFRLLADHLPAAFRLLFGGHDAPSAFPRCLPILVPMVS